MAFEPIKIGFTPNSCLGKMIIMKNIMDGFDTDKPMCRHKLAVL
jgi:hypothetical protein